MSDEPYQDLSRLRNRKQCDAAESFDRAKQIADGDGALRAGPLR